MTSPKKSAPRSPRTAPLTPEQRAQPIKRTYGSARAKTAPLPPLEPRRERRALSHVGGEVTLEGGTEEEQKALTEALAVKSDEGQVMADVHGFHSYPARLHPITAQRLIAGLTQPGARVLDPFCGSGTVVVEARALGREALGSDLNPLAVELSWLKSRGPTPKFSQELVQTALRIAEVAEERRLARTDPYRLYDEETRERYPIHTLLELDSITFGIEQLPKGEIGRMLRLVVSSTLTKLSFSEGDTTRQKAPRRLPSGFAIQLFVDKTRELAQRLTSYTARIPERTPRAYVTHADARRLSYVEPESIDLVVTSPPYPGVYDYLDHHLHRLRWLGLRESHLERQEIGARRAYRRLLLGEAAELWQAEIGEVLLEMRRVLTRDGRAVLVIADSVVDRQALRADEQIEKAAEYAGMKICALASQERPLFLYGADTAFRYGPRQEHVVILRPGGKPKKFVRRLTEDLPELQEVLDTPRTRGPRRDGPPRGEFRGRDERGGPPRGEFRGRDERGGPPRGEFRGRPEHGTGPRGEFRGRDERGGPPRGEFRGRDERSYGGPPRHAGEDNFRGPRSRPESTDARPRSKFGPPGPSGPAGRDRNRGETRGAPPAGSKPRAGSRTSESKGPRREGPSGQPGSPRKGWGPKGW